MAQWILTDNTGWVRARLLPNFTEVALPEFLQVEYEKMKVNAPISVKNGQVIVTSRGGRIQVDEGNRYYFSGDKQGQERDFFTIMEGPYRGKKGCIACKAAGSWFGNAQPAAPVNLKFIMQKRELENERIVGVLQFSSRTVEALTFINKPLAPGRYFLRLPDAPHQPGQRYVGACERPKTWFRVDAPGNIFLHPGTVSSGCITIPIKDWNEVYWHVAKARKGDGLNVGMVEVVNAIGRAGN